MADNTISPIPGITHMAPPEVLNMDKWHFLFVLERMQRDSRRFRPHGEWCLIPLGIFLTTMQALLTSDFKDAFNIEKSVWKSVAVLSAEISAVVTIGLFIWWLIDKCIRRVKGPEEILEEIITEMAKDRQRAAAVRFSEQASETEGIRP